MLLTKVNQKNMRCYTRNFILTVVSILAILLLCPALHANTAITVNWSNTDSYAFATTTGTTPMWSNQLVFCLDGNQYYNSYTGHNPGLTDKSGGVLSAAPTNTREEEAAFLVAYSGVLDPNRNAVNLQIEKDIQLAIWYVMTTLPTSKSMTTNALGYVDTAVKYHSSADVKYALIWTPTGFNAIVRGSTPVNGDQRFISNVVPEPGTMVFLGTGVLLLALSRIRRRR